VTDLGPIGERRARIRREERRAGRRRVVWAVGSILVAALAFFAGIAVGRAVEETPTPGGTQTSVRTLTPATLPPVSHTVTVTTGAP
jgi:hypothetical protein